MKKAESLVNKLGFASTLAIHIIRYCKEKNISPADLIKKFKENELTAQVLLHVSFNGYDSFSKIADTAMATLSDTVKGNSSTTS